MHPSSVTLGGGQSNEPRFFAKQLLGGVVHDTILTGSRLDKYKLDKVEINHCSKGMLIFIKRKSPEGIKMKKAV